MFQLYNAIASTTLLFNSDLNHDCLIYMLSLRFLGSKFLINLQR